MATYRHLSWPIQQVSFAHGARTSGAVNVTNAAGGTLILAANAARKAVLIVNESATLTVYLGASGVTTLIGVPIRPGGGYIAADVETSAWYGIVAAGAADVRYMEVA